uniref:Uncharacterized protein n=2 Tax=Aegilops tauschii subsp. strangulata TaxID=200361 RepID=A0A453EB77_AEGTS
KKMKIFPIFPFHIEGIVKHWQSPHKISTYTHTGHQSPHHTPPDRLPLRDGPAPALFPPPPTPRRRRSPSPDRIPPPRRNMAALLMRRLAGTYRGRAPLAAAAVGGAAFFYASSNPTVAHMEEKGEDAAAKVALNPEKWLEFKLQEKATVSHDSELFRFSFDPSTKLGLDVASCLVTRAPIGQEVEGKRKYVIRP